MRAVLFAELVATSNAVGATRARSRKIAAIAELLARLEPDELPVAVALLTGEPRQGKIGIGWATVSRLDVPAAGEASLEILEVEQALDALAIVNGPGSQAKRAEILGDVFGRATADEQWFLGRLLVGELRQGALAGIMSDAVARSAGVPATTVRRATMLAGDLPYVAELAHREGSDGLASVRLTLGKAIQPMLAQTAEDVTEALDLATGGEGAAVSVEWKLDGARVQIHRQGEHVRIFTRNLNDVTSRLPEVVALVRSLPADSLLLDGEAVGWSEEEVPELFQDIMSRFGRNETGGRGEVGPERDEDDLPSGAEALQARFFDLLHLDGEDLIDRPLSERLAALDCVAARWRIPGQITGDPAVAQTILDEALARGHEGVMVKAASSPYEAGRRGGAWRKVKPVHTLDLVVLGAEWGSGRRRGWLSNLHLGARSTREAGEGSTGGAPYVMVGKTFKGLTDELLTWQTERLGELATDEPSHDPGEERGGVARRVVYVRPALVVEIAIDGVQVSTRYPGGVALRFARVRRYRPDKDPGEADTIDTVRAFLARSRPS